jgi:hypothetical protein
LEIFKEQGFDINHKEVKRMEEGYQKVIRKKDKMIHQLQAYKLLIVDELKIIKQIVQNLNYKE